MITLPTNFESDIQGQNLNLFPIVIIGNFEGVYSTVNAKAWMDNSIHLSTKSFSHTASYGGSPAQIYTSNTKPLLLNIPSIKESMDFENRKYKISNVTLKISNFEHGGERFSDYAGNLINEEVRIFWWSKSTLFLMPIDKFPTYVEDYPSGKPALLTYKGFIRRYSHDDETVTLQLEDSTQGDLHADVPVARLGDGDEIPDKYKLKPVPMVYGYVDYSPCVIYRDEITEADLNGDIIILADNTINIDGINMDLSGFTTDDYLHIFEEDYYYDVLETTEKNIDYGDLLYTGKTQYTQSNEIIYIQSYFSGNLDLNTVADNLLQCRLLRKADSFFLKGEDFNEWGKIYTINLYPASGFDIYANNEFVGGILDANHTWEKASDGDEGTSMTIQADNFSGYLYGSDDANSWIQFIAFEFGFETPNFDIKSGVYTDICLKSRVEFGDWTPEGDFTTVVSSHFWYPKSDGTGNDYNFFSPTIAYGSQGITSGTAYNYDSIVSPPSEAGGSAWSDSDDAIEATTIIYNEFSDISKISFVTDFHISLQFPQMGWEFAKIDFYELFLRCYFDVTDIRKKDFYANVNGRTDDNGVYE